MTIEYYPIVRVTGTTASGVEVDDWTPLTGSVQATSSDVCRAVIAP